MTSQTEPAALSRLRQVLSSYPTVGLMEGPTPLQPLPNLSAVLGIDLWLKRDDLTPIGLGGDKPRKLDYEFARAVAAGADVIVTSGSAQSNHARLTTAAARKLGLDVVLVLSNDEHAQLQGNLLTVHMMGGEVVLADTDDHWDLDADVNEVCDRLRSQGRTPYFIPISGTTPHSCLGYVAGGLELIDQTLQRALEPDVVYVPFGTGGIFAAYLLTMRAVGRSTKIVGISVNRDTAKCERNLAKWWTAVGDLMETDPGLQPGSYAIYDEFVGSQYGDATPDCLDAILLMAKGEGVLLDPVYSGKVFAGLIAHVTEGRIGQGSRVVMLHSGGVPANFAYHAEIETHLRAGGRTGLARDGAQQ